MSDTVNLFHPLLLRRGEAARPDHRLADVPVLGARWRAANVASGVLGSRAVRGCCAGDCRGHRGGGAWAHLARRDLPACGTTRRHRRWHRCARSSFPSTVRWPASSSRMPVARPAPLRRGMATAASAGCGRLGSGRALGTGVRSTACSSTCAGDGGDSRGRDCVPGCHATPRWIAVLRWSNPRRAWAMCSTSSCRR